MNPQIKKYYLILGLLLTVLCLADRASATVYINRVPAGPPENPCGQFEIRALSIESSVTWDGSFQNAWGACLRLPPGPPFITEHRVEVRPGGQLDIRDGMTPLEVVLQQQPLVLHERATLTMESASLGNVSMGPNIGIAGGGGTVTARRIRFSGSGFTSASGLAISGYPTATFDNCEFNFTGMRVQSSHSPLRFHSVTPSSTLRFNNCTFSYAGEATVLLSIDHREGRAEILNSTFTGINGQSLIILNGADVTLNGNTFRNTACNGDPPVGSLNCGAPVSILATRIRSIRGNSGVNNRINGIVLNQIGYSATQTANWSTTGNFPLVAMRGNIVIDENHTLNLERGTVLKFDNGVGMIVNGILNANGVTFTSLNDSSVAGVTIAGRPAAMPGDWTGIYIVGRGDPLPHASADFTNCTVQFSGGVAHPSAAIQNGDNASTTITNCTITQSGRGVNAAVTLRDAITVRESRIQNNRGYGIHLIGDLGASRIASNVITGNEQGIEVYAPFRETLSHVTLVGNRISGNTQYGIAIPSTAAPYVINNIISANGQGGILKVSGWGADRMRIWNNTIFGNGGHGIRLEGTATTAVPIANNLIMDNVGYGIFEDFSTGAPRFNALYGNSAGLYQRTDGRSLSIVEINALSGAAGNIAEPPNVGQLASGSIDNASITFDPATGTSTLTDADADFSALNLIDETINPNTNQNRQFLIVAQTDHTITVVGNMRSVASAGTNSYLVTDPLSYNPDSPLIDAGDPLTHPDLPATDFGGRPRIIGPVVDIGAHEFDPQEGN